MKKIVTYFLILFTATSCLNTKKFRDEMQLFQKGLDSIATYQYNDLKIKPGDNLIIKVYTLASTNQEQTNILNLGGIGKTEGTYLVNNEGQIDLPKIGLIKVEGQSVREIKKNLQEKWSPYVKDIGVNIQFEEMTVNLMGEFKSPGVKRLRREKVTLIDAIAEGGGLTDDGRRSDIMIIREEKGARKIYKVDLRDAKFYNSAVAQLQQNDLIFVPTSDFKFRQRSLNNLNTKLGPTMVYLSFLNFALVIIILINTLSR